jgi:hypothetical protein
MMLGTTSWRVCVIHPSPAGISGLSRQQGQLLLLCGWHAHCNQQLRRRPETAATPTQHTPHTDARACLQAYTTQSTTCPSRMLCQKAAGGVACCLYSTRSTAGMSCHGGVSHGLLSVSQSTHTIHRQQLGVVRCQMCSPLLPCRPPGAGAAAATTPFNTWRGVGTLLQGSLTAVHGCVLRLQHLQTKRVGGWPPWKGGPSYARRRRHTHIHTYMVCVMWHHHLHHLHTTARCNRMASQSGVVQTN